MTNINSFRNLSTPRKLFRSMDNVRALNILGEATIKALPVSDFTKVGLRGGFHCIGALYHHQNNIDGYVRSNLNALGTGGHIGLTAMTAIEGAKLLSTQTKTFRFLDNTIRAVGFGVPNAIVMLSHLSYLTNRESEKEVKSIDVVSTCLEGLACMGNAMMLMSPLYREVARPYLPMIAAVTLGLSTTAHWIRDSSEENPENNKVSTSRKDNSTNGVVESKINEDDNSNNDTRKHVDISPKGTEIRRDQRYKNDAVSQKMQDID